MFYTVQSSSRLRGEGSSQTCQRHMGKNCTFEQACSFEKKKKRHNVERQVCECLYTTQATEGKTLLLPEEMDMIRASLVAAGNNAADVSGNTGAELINDASTVPEELFRKYTETDSRPLTPAPTLASGPPLTNRPTQEEFPVTCDPRERTTLILDLRTNSQKQMVCNSPMLLSKGSYRRSLTINRIHL